MEVQLLVKTPNVESFKLDGEPTQETRRVTACALFGEPMSHRTHRLYREALNQADDVTGYLPGFVTRGADAMPDDVVKLYRELRDGGIFEHLEVRSAQQDPALVGRIGQEHWLLARWGSDGILSRFGLWRQANANVALDESVGTLLFMVVPLLVGCVLVAAAGLVAVAAALGEAWGFGFLENWYLYALGLFGGGAFSIGIFLLSGLGFIPLRWFGRLTGAYS